MIPLFLDFADRMTYYEKRYRKRTDSLFNSAAGAVERATGSDMRFKRLAAG